MKVLYIGGTGEISRACVEEADQAGHQVTVFNRGQRQLKLPDGVENIVGDITDDTLYSQLAKREFDVICQFLAYDTRQVQRDIDLFSGHCGQYIFISTASVYEKPCRSHIIGEDTPLGNPFWAYSRNKAACETLLLQADAAGILSVTIVRPSHTYRTRLPSTVINGDHLAWRLLQDKPVIVHGDGESLWTLTHSSDFASAFVTLCGMNASLGECVHITNSDSHTWNAILRTNADLLGKQPTIIPVLSRTLVNYDPAWEGPLLGDKSNSSLFDNSKIRRLTGSWRCLVSLEEGVKCAMAHTNQRLEAGYEPNLNLDVLIDRIIEEQSARQGSYKP
ncbi:MAG: SDR family oxidoreductase [bacterium]|nr:SDR family oxidoreductase [Gammaproteobacteria bacterium]